MSGVMLESTQQSQTSSEALILFEPHLGHESTGGFSFVGSTGRLSSLAGMISLQDSQYQNGRGVP
jgi:hypothetical protein